MNRAAIALFPTLALASLACPLAGQQFHPKNIVFKGQSEYSDGEMMAAAGLSKGQALTAAEMDEHSKVLLDSGVFEDISYTFNGQDLAFQVKPSEKLFPMVLNNLPLAEGKELDAKLHARSPLFHGRVPNEGGLLEEVRKSLQAELGTHGIDAIVIAAPSVDPRLGTINTMTFAETSPRVWIGDVRLDGVSEAMAAGARAALETVRGTPFSNHGSRSTLETEVTNYYRDEAYLQAEVNATALLSAGQTPGAVTDDSGVHVPFTVHVEEGPQYRLGAIALDPGMLVTQQAFDYQAGVHPGDLARQNKLHQEWDYLARQYRNQGLMKARILTTATYDREHSKVNYAISAVPGEPYTMGTLNFLNATPELQSAIKHAWRMQQGMVFNEGAIAGFTATVGVNPALEQFFKTVNLRYSLKLNDDVRTVDVYLRFEKKN